MEYKTDQENFWAGEFGDVYTGRNQGEETVASNTALFSRILQSTQSVSTVFEFGANAGLNLIALKRLLPKAQLAALEINAKAIQQLEKLHEVDVCCGSVLNFQPLEERDLVLSKGLLIHIHPDELGGVYERLYRTSRKYICLVEYYNPSPVEIGYRGHRGKLFKRDFAGEMLDRFADLNLIDYGFVYHRDCNFSQDDTTWFLLEKRRRDS